MTEIFLVRHGRTADNTARRFQGHTDTELDDVGRGQAEILAGRLMTFDIDALYSSDLARARQTAEPIGRGLGLETVARRDLREIDVGSAAGLTKEELNQRHPAIFGDGWPGVAFPGGESYEQMSARVTAAVRTVAAAHPGQRVAIVSHGGAIRGAIAGLVAIPIRSLAGLVVVNTSITRILIDPSGAARLHSINDSAHLEEWAEEFATRALSEAVG